MNIRPLLAIACLATAAAFAAEKPNTPRIPAGPIAKKLELLFSDDFQSDTHDKRWHRVVDTFTFEKGALKGTQTRDKDIPAAAGKPAVTAHAAVFGLELPTKDSIIEVKIRFSGNTRMDVEFDDRTFTGSHYGHLCRAIVALNGVTLMDEREGKSATFPGTYEAGKTYTFTVETVGDEMRASIDGTPVGYLKSAGIGHPTKSKIELGVSGKDGYFEDIKVWNAAPAK
jgi:hypothetical protein